MLEGPGCSHMYTASHARLLLYDDAMDLSIQDDPTAEPTPDLLTESANELTAEMPTTEPTTEQTTETTTEITTETSSTTQATIEPTAEATTKSTSEPELDKDSEAPVSEPVFSVNLPSITSLEINFFMDEIEKISARTHRGIPKLPAKLTSYLFVGGYGEANYIPGLKKRGITHVLNCASVSHYGQNPYPPDSGIVGFAQFCSEDRTGYDILAHYDMAKRFIDEARAYGGRILVHCAMGVNRSCSICLAYLIDEEKMDLLAGMELLFTRRGTVPSNRFFRLKLVKFAGERGLLKHELMVNDSKKKTRNDEVSKS